MSPEPQERIPPELTSAVKAKVLGLNEARVSGVEHRIAGACSFDPAELAAARAARPAPRVLYGPRTRRQFLALAAGGSGL